MSAADFVKLRKLTEKDGEPAEAILQRAATQLKGLAEKANVELRVLPANGRGPKVSHFLQLTPAGATLLPSAPPGMPTLVTIATPDVFRSIAAGTYSPLQAYLDGKLKVHGNVGVGQQMIQRLAGSGTQTAVCPTLTSENWRLDGIGVGSLTLTGQYFTHGGTVRIVYDWGGGQYEKIVTADATGAWTATESNLSCGDIPGHPGVGVIVTATDLATGQYVTKNYSTPCS